MKSAFRYQEVFGKGNFFLELQDHGIPEQKLVNQQLLRMSQETGIELVATNDVHYTYEEDVAPHDILLCIQTGKKLADEDRMRYEGGQYFVKSLRRWRRCSPTQRRHWRTLTGLPCAAMWILSSALPNCPSTMCRRDTVRGNI